MRFPWTKRGPRRPSWRSRQLDFAKRVGRDGLDDIASRPVRYEWWAPLPMPSHSYRAGALRMPETSVVVRELHVEQPRSLAFPVSRMTFGTLDVGHGRGQIIGEFEAGGTLILALSDGVYIYPIGEPRWVQPL